MIGLYTTDMSSFAARVRIQLRYKGIEWRSLSLPPEGLKSSGFLDINPIGKIPVLVLDDGTTVVESETILDFIEQSYPKPSLVPDDPLDRVRMRTAIRVMEGYVCDSLFRLFGQLDPASRDVALTDFEVVRWRNGLALLDRFVDDAPHAVLGRMTLADCMLFPVLQLCEIIAGLLGLGDVLDDTPNLAGYYRKGRSVPLLAAAHAEIEAAVHAK